MKALFIGGTGIISTAVVRNLLEQPDWEIWLINRGNRNCKTILFVDNSVSGTFLFPNIRDRTDKKSKEKTRAKKIVRKCFLGIFHPSNH